MAPLGIKNFARSAVVTPPSAPKVGTTLTVTAGTGTLFPAAPFWGQIWPGGEIPTAANAEIVLVVAVSGDEFTIKRAEQKTAARTVVTGDNFANTITEETFREREVNSENLAEAQPNPVETPEKNGAAGDGKLIRDGKITSGSKNFESPETTFTEADKNKYVALCSGGAAALLEGAAVKTVGEGAPVFEARQFNTLTARIIKINSAHVVELEVEAKNTVTGALAIYATDDTKAVQEAVNKAVKLAEERGTGWAEVWFKHAIYGIAGELKTGGITEGNAQITIPVIPNSGYLTTNIAGPPVGTTSGTNKLKSSDPHAFKPYDVGAEVVAAGKVKAGATIVTVVSETEVVLSAAGVEAVGTGFAYELRQTIAQKQPQKISLKLKGSTESSALPQWYQLVPQQAGSLLFSFGPRAAGEAKLVGEHAQPAYSSTDGAPSMLGGPTEERGYKALRFSNMMLIIEGLTLSAPSNGTITGIEAEGISEVSVPSLGSYALGIPGFVGGNYTGGPNEFVMPSAGYEGTFLAALKPATAIRMPGKGNNDNSNILQHSVEGHTSAIGMGEHSFHANMRSVYCLIAGQPTKSKWYHSSVVETWSIEACRWGIRADTGEGMQLNAILDTEQGEGRWKTKAGATIYDPNNTWLGEVGIYYGLNAEDSLSANGAVTGASKLRIKQYGIPPGKTFSTPTLTTGVAVKNPFFVDCFVSIGGTITSVEVDGALQPGKNAVLVPSNKSVTVVGTGLSWAWTVPAG